MNASGRRVNKYNHRLYMKVPIIQEICAVIGIIFTFYTHNVYSTKIAVAWPEHAARMAQRLAANEIVAHIAFKLGFTP